MVRNMVSYYGEELLAPRSTPKLEDHRLSVSRDCLFNIFTATLRTGGCSSIRNQRTRHAMVTETHLSWFYLPKSSEIGVFTNRTIQNLISTSQRTEYASITNTIQLKTLKKIMTVYCENIRITLRTLCVKKSEYLNLKRKAIEIVKLYYQFSCFLYVSKIECSYFFTVW